MTTLGTIVRTGGDAGTWVFRDQIAWASGLNSDFSNFTLAETGGTAISFAIDQEDVVSGVSAWVDYRVPSYDGTSRTLNYGYGTSGLSNPAATYDIYLDPTDATRANLTDTLALTGSTATNQKGLTQADCGMGALGYLNQGYCHSSTKRYIANSATNSLLQRYDKTTNPTVAEWSVALVGHANQLCIRGDNGNILSSSSGASLTGIVRESSWVDGSFVRDWDFSDIIASMPAGTVVYPTYLSAGKFRLMPGITAAGGIKFIDVTVNDTTGTHTVDATRSLPLSSAGIQTMQGLYGDGTGAIAGDGVACVQYLVNTSGGATIIYDIAFPDSTTAAIRKRYGPYTWGVEAEGIGFDGTTLEVGVGTSGTNSYIAAVSFNAKGSRFRNGAPRVTSAASQTFGPTLASAGLSGRVRMRGRSLWSSPYVYNSNSNRASFGFASSPSGSSAAFFGRLSSTLTTTQGTYRTQANSGTATTGSAITVGNTTTERVGQVDLIPGVSLTYYQDGSAIASTTTNIPTVANDYATLRPVLGGGAQSDTTGMDQLTGPVAVFALQATASSSTVTPSSGSATGALASTEAADTSSATGAAPATGSTATTEASDTIAATAAASIAGALSSSEAPDTAASAGSLAVAASAACAEAADSMAASGTVSAVGSATGALAATDAADSAAAAGAVTAGGIATAGEASDTANGVGSLTARSTAALVESPDASASTATASASGAIAANDNADACSGSGQVATGAPRQYPLAGVVQEYPLAGVVQSYPLAM